MFTQPPSPQDPFPEFRQQYPGTEWGLVCGAVKGLRIWQPVMNLDKRVWLKSLYQDYRWKVGENVATCATGAGPVRTYECLTGAEGHPNHAGVTSISGRASLGPGCWRDHDPDGIDPGHACGFYAYQRDLDSNPYLKFAGLCVEGLILGYGRTVIGTKGFRCSKAKILALVLPGYMGNPAIAAMRAKQDAEIHAALYTGIARTYPGIPTFPSRQALLDAIPIEPEHA